MKDISHKKMKAYFFDTNIFLRLIIDDGTNLNKHAKELFLEVTQGKYSVFASTIIIFEIYWVLLRFYQKPKEDIISILQKILCIPNITFENVRILEKSLEIFQKENIELPDCYYIAFCKENNISEMKTFDKKLEKIFQKIAP